MRLVDSQWKLGAFSLLFRSFCQTNGSVCVFTRCHLGNVIRYDTVSKFGWGVDVRTHGIQFIVDKLLSTDWDIGEGGDDGKNGGREPKAVPDFFLEEDCVVSERAVGLAASVV